MARPLIDFIDVAGLPWHTAHYPTGTLPYRFQVISEDPDGGERTLLVELPPGWSAEQDGWFDADDEIFLLSGELSLNGERLTRYGYQFLPAGQLRRDVRSGRGARFLQFQTASPNFEPAHSDGPDFDPARAIGPLHLRLMEYERPRTPNFPAGAARKTFRLDEATGDSFWVIAMLPHWSSPLTEVHTFSEENYVLEGTIETTEGVMMPGGYLHHPPGAVHGPMRSRTGCLIITRASGPFHTDFVRVPGDYTFPEELE
ncbi:MAG: DUF4437 domain-containing protein [Dehalococcoidia bacterium]